MSPPRKYPYRKMDFTERTFIETRLAAGHSPAAIRDAMNKMVTMTPEQILKSVEVQHTVRRRTSEERPTEGHTAWERFSGRRPYNIEDVRRAYDAMRKHARGGETLQRQGRELTAEQSAAIRHDALRRRNRSLLFDDDDRRIIAHDLNPVINPEWKRGNTQKLSDAGMIWRLTNDRSVYDELVAKGITT